jgi:hypothetical protein
MPFQLKFHDDQTTGLIAVCDVCGLQVSGEEANLLWQPRETEIPGETRYPFLIVCRDPVCDRAIEERFGYLHYQNLDTGIGYLIHNLRIDLKAVRRNMEVLAMIG